MTKLQHLPLIFSIFFFSILNIQASTIHVPDDHPTIQEAIDLADMGDTVLVAPGVYREHLQFRGKDITLASHYLITGDSTFIDQTIIDAEQAGIAILLENAESPATLITGFTIANGGKNEEELMPDFVGGIICKGASPTIRHNRITGAWAVTMIYFGGIVCTESSALIEHNRIDSIFGAFVQKTGGIVAHKSNLTIRNNQIINITGGYVFQAGGGIVADSSTVVASYNLVDTSNFDSGVRQGGIVAHHSIMELINNTIVHHSYGLRLEKESAVVATNNIIYYPYGWGEFASISIEDDQSTLTAQYNNIQGGWSDGNNMNEVPMFVDTSGDYRLQAGSPCIDQGDPNSASDPDGTRADIGAFYYQQTTNTPEIEKIPELEIHPNPAIDRFYVKGFFSPQDALHLYDALGRLQGVYRVGVYGVTSVDVSDLSQGLYFIKVVNGHTTLAQGKVLVQ